MDWKRTIRDLLLGTDERRDGARFRPPMAVYYWTGEHAKAYRVRDIGSTGLFVETEDRWGPGTSLHVHLVEGPAPAETRAPKVSVLAEVVRSSPDGMAMMFLFENPKERRRFDTFLAGLRLRGESGHSLVEFALLIPLLFLVLVNAINFGGFYFAWITVASAARTGSQYASLAGATVSGPAPPSSTQIYNVVTQDISALPNRGSLAVRVCTNTNGTVACNQTGPGSFTDPAADVRPEANSFVMEWVDVGYTYQPLIPVFDFPNLGIHATLPPTTLHRQTVMRRLQ
jgi:hypothetical protein